MQRIKRLGIMGGTFDPIHTAHLALGEAAREEFCLDKVFFIVSANPPHKQSLRITEAAVRYNMVRLAVESNSYFEASDLEIKRNSPSFTYQTIDELKVLYPAAELYLIIGMDEAASFDCWRNYKSILKQCTVAAAWRPGSKTPEHGLPIEYFSAPELNIASSHIRSHIAAGKSVRYLLPEKVHEYIVEKGLYK